MEKPASVIHSFFIRANAKKEDTQPEFQPANNQFNFQDLVP